MKPPLRRHDHRAILLRILSEYALDPAGIHGVDHWARVHDNGVKIAAATGADLEVVALFALFHDAKRVNEETDPDHGQRGGDLARELRGDLVHLDDARFELLYEACRLHTAGRTTGNVTLLTCWDADRLDLWRVGVRPKPERLGTTAGRRLISWADDRALRTREPAETFRAWGYRVPRL